MIVRSFRAGVEVDEAIANELERLEDTESYEEADRLQSVIAGLLQRIYEDPEAGRNVGGQASNYKGMTAHPTTIFYRLDRRKGSILIYLVRYASNDRLSGRAHKRQADEAANASVDFEGYIEEDR